MGGASARKTGLFLGSHLHPGAGALAAITRTQHAAAAKSLTAGFAAASLLLLLRRRRPQRRLACVRCGRGVQSKKELQESCKGLQHKSLEFKHVAVSAINRVRYDDVSTSQPPPARARMPQRLCMGFCTAHIRCLCRLYTQLRPSCTVQCAATQRTRAARRQVRKNHAAQRHAAWHYKCTCTVCNK